MFTYPILPTSQRPLPLAVTSEEFTKEWYACWKDKNKDMLPLLDMFEPAIEHWLSMLNRESKPDINMISLCARLGETAEISLKKIDRWIVRITELNTLKEQLELLFIIQIRKFKYYPAQASPIMAEYVIAKDFRDAIFGDIKRRQIQNIDYCSLDLAPIKSTYQIHKDYFLLKNMDLTDWEKYLFWWMKNNIPTEEIARSTHIPFDTFKKEARYLWRLVKENYSKEE